MPRVPAVSGARVVKALEKVGFQVVRVKGSHYIMRNPEGNDSKRPFKWQYSILGSTRLLTMLGSRPALRDLPAVKDSAEATRGRQAAAHQHQEHAHQPADDSEGPSNPGRWKVFWTL